MQLWNIADVYCENNIKVGTKQSFTNAEAGGT